MAGNSNDFVPSGGGFRVKTPHQGFPQRHVALPVLAPNG